jgi:hypothetical protein
MMTNVFYDRLVAAAAEAERFLERAHVAMEEIRDKEMSFLGSPKSAAAKRASMDLTRALADVRRNTYS